MQFFTRNRKILLFLPFFLLMNQQIQTMDDSTTKEKITSSASIYDKLTNGSKYSIEQLKRLCSTENQKSLVFFLNLQPFYLLLKDFFTIIDKQLLNEIPIGISEALKKMNFHGKNFFVSKSFANTASASSLDHHIIFGETLLNSTSAELEFVTGHEIAHIQNKDAIKTLMLCAIAILAPIFINYLLKKIKQDYCKSRTLDKTIGIYGKILDIFDKNPFLGFLYQRYTFSKISCHFEKNADITAAKKTSQILGGIRFFEKDIAEDLAKKQSAGLFRYINYINPFNWLDTIFSTHPSNEERIAYLKKLLPKKN